MTPQEKLQATLEKSGIPAKEIRCYGSQVVIVAWGEPSADKWRGLLTKFCSRVRGPVKSTAYKVPYNAQMGIYPVWLVAGTV